MRPTNSADFERRFLTPFGWAITYKGTTDIIDGMDVRLSDWSEMEVRYILADIALGGPVDYYRARTDVPDAVEALRRYDAGVQCMNSAEFERTFVRGRGGWEILYAGTSRRLWGYDVKLVSGPVPGDVAPVSDTGLFIGPNGHRYGDGILSMEDAAYTLRVLAGLNAIP